MEMTDSDQKKKTGPISIHQILSKYTLDDKGGRITREFQDYGMRLAAELDDMGHKALYIKLAKTVDRRFLEQARSFVLDSKANSRARLFMWKMRELLLAERTDPTRQSMKRPVNGAGRTSRTSKTEKADDENLFSSTDTNT